MDRLLIATSAAFGFLGVATGAFGAHALRERLPADLMAIFQTAVLYHLIHALAVGLAGLAVPRFPGALAQTAGWLFAAGIVVFSGSLYALALSGVRVLGAITPIGGLCFLAGWALLAVAALRG
jgi:uncharacterized membrane protein YgdD (TMEM256/DUF423 family)